MHKMIKEDYYIHGSYTIYISILRMDLLQNKKRGKGC